MTTDDIDHLFSPERLVRTQISTLVGLLIKGDIDYAIPDPAVTQQYIERTEALLEEIHRAMLASTLSDLGFEEALKKETNPFAKGNVLREAIFYSGESGYSFQYRDFAVKKYASGRRLAHIA